MKGFFKWFNRGSKMKRWLLLIIIGILLASFGMVNLLKDERHSLSDLPVIILSFVAGFTFVVVGIVFIQKRTLELFVQETDARDEAKDGQVKSLIFNKKVYDEGPNIVVIGGGAGLDSVLKGLKNYTNNITAIVTISDYGEAATDSRKLLETLPLDDIKNSFVALSNNEAIMNGIMNYKFTSGRLKEMSFGDIYLLAMKELYGDFTSSIEQSKDVLNITGRVLPVTLEAIDICAELEDGTVVKNKNKIPETVSSKVSKINRIFINPTNCMPAPGVIDAIKKADAIIIGPGSLYTNVIPNLLVKGVAKAIKENKGFKIYISNIMTDPGQTDNYTLSDHIKAIQEHAGKGIVDYCIYDTGEIIPEFVRRYNQEGQDLVETDTSKAKEEGIKLVQRNLSYIDGEYIRHNPDAIASSIIELVVEDMKFRDMENDSRYVMLNSRLKDTKKKLKTTTNIGKNKKGHEKNTRTSKFIEKYQDRINSIKSSDQKTLKRKEDKNKIKQNREKQEKLKNIIEEEIKESSKIKDTNTIQKINTQKVEKKKDNKKDNKKVNKKNKSKRKHGKHA